MPDKIKGLEALKKMGAQYATQVQANPDLEGECRSFDKAFRPDHVMPHRPGLLDLAMAPRTEMASCTIESTSLIDAYLDKKMPTAVKHPEQSFAGENGEFCKSDKVTTKDGKLISENRSCYPKLPFGSVKGPGG